MVKERSRKNRGSLSVLEEFTTDGVGEIIAQPKLSLDEINKINEKTRLADIPLEAKSQHKPLDSRETGVSSVLDKPVDSRETGVSSALDKKDKEKHTVSSALDKPLDSRETAVRKKQNSALEISELVGKEKALILFIADECRKLGELSTNYIGTEELKSLLSLDSLGLRNLIFRVKEKGFIEVVAKQLGRVGLRKFKVSRSVYQQAITLALDSRELDVRQPLDKPLDKPLEGPAYSSSNLLNINTNTIELPENLRRFGISTVNLQNLISSCKSTQEVVERSLAALSFDVEQGKKGNLANILFGVLGSGREYISQAYTESVHLELESELKRIIETQEAAKKLKETQLKAKYLEFIQSHPDFISEVRTENAMISDPSIIENIAFAKFCEQEN